MAYTREQTEALIQRYLDGECTPGERALVEQTYQAYTKQQPFTEKDIDFTKISEESWAHILSAIGQRIQQRPRRRWRYVAAASVVLCMVLAGLYIYLHRQPATQQVVQNLSNDNDVAPGTNGAVLTLADGRKIVLGQATAGEIARQNGASLKKLNDSTLVYTADAKGTPAAAIYNTLQTPRGRQYNIILPDGSRVWLNASSSLRYPAVFTGKERLVELTGEAYFEVVHNSRVPFRVKSGNEIVEDIGTRFNINAYADEPSVKTTLLEGAVKVSAEGTDVQLRPGQQSRMVNGRLKVADVDVDQAAAWKNGYFAFDNADLPSVLRQLSRWYNVDVVYTGTLPQRVFAGEMQKDLTLSQVLKILEKNKVHFRIEGRKLIVLP